MYTTGVTPPQGVWWKPAHKSQKVWFTIAFVWCLILFAMMPLWHLRAGQNPTGIRGRSRRTGRGRESVPPGACRLIHGAPWKEPPI